MQITDGTLTLDRDLGSAAAPNLYAAVHAAKGQPLSIDASDVRHLGVQCLQVLLSARAQWSRDELAFEFSARSVEFDEAVSRLGIEFGAMGSNQA
jgi:chemotaxis protein CheX